MTAQTDISLEWYVRPLKKASATGTHLIIEVDEDWWAADNEERH